MKSIATATGLKLLEKDTLVLSLWRAFDLDRVNWSSIIMISSEFVTYVGQKIRELREEKGFSQADMGKALGMNKSSIARYESGKQRLALDEFYLIANWLQVSPPDLLPPEAAALEQTLDQVDTLLELLPQLTSQLNKLQKELRKKIDKQRDMNKTTQP